MVNILETWCLSHRFGFARFFLGALFAIILTVAVFAFRLDSSLSVQAEPTASPVSARPASPASSDSPTFETQFEHLRWFDERLLQTVYWSLGTIATVSALFVAFSWFLNVRLADRDRQQLWDEIRSGLKNETEDRLKEIEAKASAMVSSKGESERKYHRDTDALRNRLAATQFLLLETVARSELSSGNLNEVVDTAVLLIDGGRHAAEDPAILRGLDLLQQVLQNGAQPTVKQAAEINVAIDNLPDQFATDREIVRQLLLLARARMNEESSWEG